MRVFSVGSTTAAGTIIQTARGAFSLLAEIFKRIRSECALFDECLHGFRMKVMDDALVASLQKTPHHVGPHSAQSDHAQFHVVSSL